MKRSETSLAFSIVWSNTFFGSGEFDLIERHQEIHLLYLWSCYFHGLSLLPFPMYINVSIYIFGCIRVLDIDADLPALVIIKMEGLIQLQVFAFELRQIV